LHLRSYSFGHYPRFMTIGEDGDENCSGVISAYGPPHFATTTKY